MKDKTGKELSGGEVLEKGMGRFEAILLEFEAYLLHCIGTFIPSHHIRRFFYRIAGIKIGRGSSIHMGLRMFNPSKIAIGEDSIIGEGAFLDGRASLSIGNHVDIASEVMVYNAKHDVHTVDFAPRQEPVVIEDYVFVGPRAIILPGVTIKKGAVVAAGAVVTKNVGEMQIVGGVPAEVIGERKVKDLAYKLGRAAWFR